MKGLYTLLFSIFSMCAFAGVQDSTGVKKVDGKTLIVHVVEKGETLYSISKRYKSTVDEVKKANGGVSTLNVGQTLLIPFKGAVSTEKTTASTKTHTVQKGETLYAISKQYNVSVEEVKKWNKLSDNAVSVGQKLIVGQGTTASVQKSIPEYHIVAKGEGLYSIARKYNLNASELKSHNKLKSDELAVGQKLYLPGGVKSTPQQVVVDKPTLTKEAKSYANKQFVRVKESGTAVVKVSDSMNSQYSYCYHANLPIGSVIQITDKQTGRYVWARVKANFTPANKEIIWVNKTVADRLGVQDSSFTVVISYVK